MIIKNAFEFIEVLEFHFSTTMAVVIYFHVKGDSPWYCFGPHFGKKENALKPFWPLLFSK